MEQIEGFVERITYRSEENGYTVLILSTEEGEQCLVGSFPSIGEGEYVKASGEMVVHPVYGAQLKMEQYELVMPTDVMSVERYLGSGAVKGIGPALASRITKKFGDDTFRIIEEEPERLAEVKGISQKSAREIAMQVVEKREARNAMIFLQQYGITLSMAAKIYREYGVDVYRIIKENPYQLADDISGVGFKIADDIAKKAGILVDSQFRIQSGLIYTLQQASMNGHTYLPAEELKQLGQQILGVEIDGFTQVLSDMAIEKKVVVKQIGDEISVYGFGFYQMESQTAYLLKEMNVKDSSIPEEDIQEKLRFLEKESNVVLDGMQKKAVFSTVQNGVCIVTGGPGTGKTTTINMIIRYFIREGLDILLAAPTGRAAKRMTEATGYEAQTIHRLLEISGEPNDRDRMKFQRNSDMPLEADVVIIDEMSMVDIQLMHALLRAMVPGMRLILVGDADQLPSVGPGNVLHDLIDSDCFPVVKLNRIFRQEENSDIIVNAHKINEGQMVPISKTSKDFLFIQRDNAANIVGATITLLKDKLPGYVKSETRELQVLTPMRKGMLGVEQLNTTLQTYLNPPSRDKGEKEFPFGTFREGDKVMQIKNNYQMEWEIPGDYPPKHGTGVFNGDTGIIRKISLFEESITVEYEEGKLVIYPFKQADELELAYAMTIHKSQGSEYPAVILPLLDGPRMLMTRNLLYTAVTRAKSCVCVVGSYDTFCSMIQNVQEQKRYSGLKTRIRESYGDY